MQIATMLGLAGTVTCAGVFIGQKKWVLASAFLCAVAYMVLETVIHVRAVPGMVLQALPILFLVLIVYEVITKLVMK
jgi:hypothetical protein